MITSQGARYQCRNLSPELSIYGTYHTEPTDDLDYTDPIPSSGKYIFILVNYIEVQYISTIHILLQPRNAVGCERWIHLSMEQNAKDNFNIAHTSFNPAIQVILCVHCSMKYMQNHPLEKWTISSWIFSYSCYFAISQATFIVYRYCKKKRGIFWKIANNPGPALTFAKAHRKLFRVIYVYVYRQQFIRNLPSQVCQNSCPNIRQTFCQATLPTWHMAHNPGTPAYCSLPRGYRHHHPTTISLISNSFCNKKVEENGITKKFN